MARRYGCRWGLPHDMVVLKDTVRVKWERCSVCRRTFRWNKGYRMRIDNRRYLEAHARNYAQKGGATNRLYMRLYEPTKCKIIL